MVKVSIIIPAHNEEKRIARTLDSYSKFFSKKIKDFEIIVVLNGCEDNTLLVIKDFNKRNKRIKYLDFKESIGKGSAIIEGFKVAKGDLIGFVDADMATPPHAFYDLVKNINNYDGIIASRWIKGAKISMKQNLFRRFSSRSFNYLMKALFFMPYNDTQTGAKLFKKNAIKYTLKNLGITRWAFDVDLLYNMKIKNLRIKEIPTEWYDKPGSQLKIIKAIPEMFLALIRLRLIYSKLKFIINYYDKLPEFLKIHHKLK